MKIGKPAWGVVAVSAAGALGAAWRHDWRDVAILGVVAVGFAIASLISQRRGSR